MAAADHVGYIAVRCAGPFHLLHGVDLRGCDGHLPRCLDDARPDDVEARPGQIVCRTAGNLFLDAVAGPDEARATGGIVPVQPLLEGFGFHPS